MDSVDVAVVAGFVVVYGVVSGRLAGTAITGPMVYVAFGVLVGDAALGLVDVGLDSAVVAVLAEGTLVLVLFTDAIRIDLRRLRTGYTLPLRLLGLGMPLTIAAGTAVALAIFPTFGFWEALLLAAILAPTDAALGQAVMTARGVPVRVRQALNVESGLNDGIGVPVVTFALAFTAMSSDYGTTAEWFEFLLRQLGLGVTVGILVGACGGMLIDRASRTGWMDGTFRQLATLAVGVGAFAAATPGGGNGFIAAFVAGVAFGVVARDQCPNVYDFAEDEGQLLALLVFLLFGAGFAGPALGHLDWRIALYAAASLTVVRMVPVAVALLGAGLRPTTVAFLGWFGPRGLASIVFGLVVAEEAGVALGEEILLIVTWAVLASVALHGVTAAPLARRYGSRIGAGAVAAMAEEEPVPELKMRFAEPGDVTGG